MTIRDSRTGSVLADAARRLRDSYVESGLSSVIRAARERTTTVVAGSRFVDAVEWAESVTRSSWLYRWFTAEPDPDVIVIDLRETVIAGALIAVVDRAIERLVGPWRGSGARALVDGSVEAFVESPVRLVSLVLFAVLTVESLIRLGLGSIDGPALGVRLVAMGLALAGTRVERSLDEIVDSRVVRLLLEMLEPPEPPERDE